MKKILILENDKAIRNMINTLVNNNDYKILSSENYSTDHGLLKQIPDLVIADLTSIKKEKVELLIKEQYFLNMFHSHDFFCGYQHIPQGILSDKTTNNILFNYHLRSFTKGDSMHSKDP
jgi:hypothetical protein